MIMIMYKYFRKFFTFFKEERKPFLIYSCLSLIAALFELCGVALIYPFILRILSGTVSTNINLSPIVIGLFIILMFLLKNIFMIFYAYIQTRYTNNFWMKVQRRLIRYYLGSDFQETSKISLAQKNKTLILLTNNIVNNFIFRLLNLAVNFFIFILLSLCLALKFPIATVSALIFGFFAIIIQTKLFKPYLAKIANDLSNSSLEFNQALNEALINIKAVKVSGNEYYFYNKFKASMSKYCDSLRKNNFFNTIPPYVTEPFAILLLFVLIAVIFSQTYTEPQKLVASLALVGAAIFRLTPAISRIQVNINGINAALPLVKEFLDLYETQGINNVPEIVQNDFMNFKDSLELKNINFGYTEDKQVLKDINFKIYKGEFVGIAGESGAGKTTLIDIITGLYKPNSGEIYVDGKIKNMALKVGYVPQEFVLIKGNIRENIAFGNSVINDNLVIDALKKAQLFDFITKNYSEGIYANPFVDSIGFSQGQKQRLAIARALYLNPDILILDEATSSLDLKTENEICKVLKDLKGNVTTIVIAHRLSTIKDADKIIFMEDGNVQLLKSFNELVEKQKNIV